MKQRFRRGVKVTSNAAPVCADGLAEMHTQTDLVAGEARDRHQARPRHVDRAEDGDRPIPPPVRVRDVATEERGQVDQRVEDAIHGASDGL